MTYLLCYKNIITRTMKYVYFERMFVKKKYLTPALFSAMIAKVMFYGEHCEAKPSL